MRKKSKLHIIKNILLIAIFFIIINFPLPYYIYSPGGIENGVDRVEIEDSYNSKGSFNLAFVNERKGTIGSVAVSKLLKTWDTIKKSEVTIEDEEYEEINLRSQIMLEEANNNAIIAALNELGESYSYSDKKYKIIFISEEANTTFEVGDQIIELENQPITNVETYSSIIDQYGIGNIVEIKVIDKNNKEKLRTAQIYEEENKKITGIYIVELKTINYKKEINYTFKANESGSSGGLIMALTIYNALTQEDITNGKKIVGTGTISEDGIVGEIDGIKYKLAGAEKANAEIFLCPTGNFEEALKEKEINNYNIEIIEATTLENTINILKNK